MAEKQLLPVIVGFGDVKSKDIEAALEPLELILRAIHIAAEDTKLSDTAAKNLLSKVDSLEVVRTWTWPYDDLDGQLANAIGAKPAHKLTTARHGGDQPAKLVDQASRRISTGQSEVVIVTGGEALASLSAYMSAKGLPPPHWTSTQQGLDSIWTQEIEKSRTWYSPPTTVIDFLNIAIGGKHGIGAPIQIYPLYENALRAQRGQPIEQNNTESACIYAKFAKIAERNQYAWSHRKPAVSEAAIGTITKENRIICFPYPLLMNAFNTVNLAAACLLTSTKRARELGISESQWIYVRGGAGTRDSNDFLRRPNFYASPSISASLDAAMAASNIPASEVDAYDFYSCFPIVPKLACRHLGIPLTPPFSKPITLLGGLTSFGGAGNNYSMHAITHMSRYLREGNGNNGLILANGGLATYQHVVCLSRTPPKEGDSYCERNLLPESLPSLPDSEIEVLAEGQAVVETYTVDFGRDGKPVRGYVIGRLIGSGKRFIANHANEWTLGELSSRVKEPIGRVGMVRVAEGEKNIFTFPRDERL